MGIKYLLEQNDNALSFLRAVIEYQEEQWDEARLYDSQSYESEDRAEEWEEAVAESKRVFGDDETYDALQELDRR